MVILNKIVVVVVVVVVIVQERIDYVAECPSAFLLSRSAH